MQNEKHVNLLTNSYGLHSHVNELLVMALCIQVEHLQISGDPSCQGFYIQTINIGANLLDLNSTSTLCVFAV